MKTIPEVDIYVRFCETDAGGHVSNTSYFLYYEEARTKFFETLSFGLKDRKNFNFIVARLESNFVKQSFASQRLRVTTGVSNIGTKSYTLVHEIKDANTGMLIANGTAVIVCYDFQEQHSVAIPMDLRTSLEEYLITTRWRKTISRRE